MPAPLLIGVDVSRWQGVVPWREVAASGVKYAWIKATHGLGAETDPQFATNWNASRDVLPYGRGAYTWLTDAGPVAIVERLVRVLDRAGDAGELFVAVDFEEPSTRLRGEALVLHLLRALRRASELTGGAMVYTGAWYLERFVAPDRTINGVVSGELLDELVTFPLWFAQWPRLVLADARMCAALPPALPPARLPKPWRDRSVECAVQQFDGDGGCVLPNGVDADYNLATEDGLRRVTYGERDTIRTIAAATPRPFTDAATPLRAGEGEHDPD